MTAPHAVAKTVHIPETIRPGMRLGRHVNHDPRSLRYAVRPNPAVIGAGARWVRQTPILDQGDTGSCTGNAMCGLLGTDPFYGVLSQLPDLTKLDETEALTLYSEATELDSFPGTYPPDDTGSDGLSVAKAAQKAGLISGYQHVLSLAAAKTAILSGPFIIGSNWYESMDSPSSAGLVKVAGAVRGGHEYECIGYDPVTDVWELVNSWGTGWGLEGHFFYSSASFARLLSEDGDATVPTPITVAPPVPQPVDGGSSFTFTADEVSALDDWADHPHVWRKATKAAKAWAAKTPAADVALPTPVRGRRISRSSQSGQFVSGDYADRHPDTTETEER